MKQVHLARRAGVPVVAAICGALVGTPALADVTVAPTSAPQGGAENFTFHVTNTGTEPIGTVTLKIPDDTPVAEVYPLSVDDWAPKIGMKTLSSPLPSLHDGIPESQVTSTITWIAMPGRALAPGRAADLSIAIGPLPTLSTMLFTLTTAYAGGSPGPAMPPAAVTLTPTAPGQGAAGHAGHAGTPTSAAGGTDAPLPIDAADISPGVDTATRGPSEASLAGWLLAALLLLTGLWRMVRNRHRAPEDDQPPAEEPADGPAEQAAVGQATAEDDAEPIAVGQATAEDDAEPIAVGKWSFKG